MTTIKSTSGKKVVNISNNGSGSFIAMYVQLYDGSEQVLESKTYSSEKRALSWAKKVLN